MINTAGTSSVEFNLINRFFKRKLSKQSAIIKGIGDDCALIAPEIQDTLAITTDTLVAGVHFFSDTDPNSLGHKSLAVNLSDLAAMGAKPRWFVLALTIPSYNEKWIANFAKGLFALADQYSVELIGGDTTKGPLTITIQAIGLVPCGQALLRSGAKLGDTVCVSGSLGDAGLGLKVLKGEFKCSDSMMLNRYHCPQPRINLGLRLRKIASTCIDVSDGLAADLSHVLDASEFGATLFWDNIPLSSNVREYIEITNDWRMPLIAGDDYELCFTVPPDQIEILNQSTAGLDCSVSCIGVIEERAGLRILKNEQRMILLPHGYSHF